MQPPNSFVGVDVAKATLSAAAYGARGVQDLKNDETSIKVWLRTLPADACVAVESTGKFHLTLVRLVHESGRRAYVLNSRDVFFHAKAVGSRAKTDRKDAQLIASYLAQHCAELKPWAPATRVQDRVQELLRCRATVSSKRSSLRQALKGIEGLDSQIEAMEAKFDALLDEIDHQVSIELERDEVLVRQRRLLRTITGIGPQASALFTGLLSRIPFANADALIAFTGLDPRPNDSGSKAGRRKLSKRGNAELRRQVYLCAFAASHSKALGPLYRAIRNKGFKTTEALVILGRKILRVAWAVWKSGKPFDPSQFVVSETGQKT